MDGRKAGSLTANPKIIDGVITRAWQDIYEGNVSDVDGMVVDLLKKYKTTLLAQSEFRMGDLSTQEVYDGLTGVEKQLEAWMVGNRRN